MMPYTLTRDQFILRPIEEVFAFFSDARNLEAITPPWLCFKVTTPGPIEMRPGALIEYEIRWRIVRLNWATEIRVWSPPHEFVDVQIKGPYRRWEHTHRFAAVEGGTRITDRVEYALPLGPLGRLVHALRVRRDLESIFDYRIQRIEAIFADDGRTGEP